MLRLADPLSEEPFGLELLSGGPDAAAREVRGAHAVEVDAPARWLGRDWIMLTTGVRLRGSADAQRELVPQLEDGGASALGTFTVSEIAPERLDPKVDEILSVLRADPPLHDALSAYSEHDLDVAAAAASLHMRRNSLRDRLARAEQMLGCSLKRPATIAAIHSAQVAEAP